MLSKTDVLAQKLVERIRDGELLSGSRLPPAETLASEFQVSRGTARAAVERLRGRGLIYKRGNSFYVERREDER